MRLHHSATLARPDSEFDSEQVSGIIFNRRPPVEMADFHGEVTVISIFDGIRDIFEARFHNATLFLTAQIYIDYCLNSIFTIQL
jgi:hypothetical protein